jgi:hypothetical protein
VHAVKRIALLARAAVALQCVQLQCSSHCGLRYTSGVQMRDLVRGGREEQQQQQQQNVHL